MQINNTEINGFLIEQFNQYDLQVGKPEGVCPLCSSDRRSENQKKKCASYDWQRGLGTCHNCNQTFQLHTYQQRTSDKVYIKPEPIKVEEPGSNVQEWFKSRGISKETLLALKVTEGSEYMPQTGQNENAIHFNYFENGELINIKYRDGRKKL